MTKRKNIYPIAGKVAMAHLVGIKMPQLEYCDENQEFIFSNMDLIDINWKLNPSFIEYQRFIRKALLAKAIEYIGAHVGLHMYEKDYPNLEEEFDQLNREFEEVEKEFQFYCRWIKSWDTSGKDLLDHLKKVLEEELLIPQNSSAIHLVAEYLGSTDEHTVKASTLRSLCNNQIPFGLLSYKTPNMAPEWASALESI